MWAVHKAIVVRPRSSERFAVFLDGLTKQDERIGFVDAPPVGRINSSSAKAPPCESSAGHDVGQRRLQSSGLADFEGQRGRPMAEQTKQQTFFIKDPFTEEVKGPLSVAELKQWFAGGGVEAWGVSKSANGPWTLASQVKGLAPQKASEAGSVKDEAKTAPNPNAVAQRTTQLVPSAQKPVAVSQRTQSEGHVEVHQLDTTTFLVEGLPLEAVFSKLRQAATKQHQVVGAFPKSGTIRGQGRSGISFVIAVAQTEEGVQFAVDGETPQGPANFGVLFNPTSAQGWATAGAAALFNSVVNSKAAASVEGDVTMLMLNLLDAFGAETLLLGTGEGSVRVSHGDNDLSNVVVELIGSDQLRTNFPRQRLPGLVFRVLQTASLSRQSDVLQAVGLKGTARFDRLSEIAIDASSGQVTGKALPRGGAAIPMYFHFVVSVSEGAANDTLLKVETACPAHESPDLALKQSNAIRDVIAVELGAKVTGQQVDAGAVIRQSNEKVSKSGRRKIALGMIAVGGLCAALAIAADTTNADASGHQVVGGIGLWTAIIGGVLFYFSREKSPSA